MEGWRHYATNSVSRTTPPGSRTTPPPRSQYGEQHGEEGASYRGERPGRGGYGGEGRGGGRGGYQPEVRHQVTPPYFSLKAGIKREYSHLNVT